MATLHHDHHGHTQAYLKGAPERILAMCRYQVNSDGTAVWLDADALERTIHEMASEGLRVLAMTLAFEPPEPGVMQQPPRPRDESLLRGFVVWRVGFVSLLFLAGIFGAWFWAMDQYQDTVIAGTLAAVGAVLVLQAAFTYLPWFQTTFATGALPLASLAFASLAGLAVLVVLELETALRRLTSAAG